MVVYNGENYIKEALESLLAQDYTNFELIISDNASTDKTKNICLNYMKKDKRIQYYRNDKNIGVELNLNSVIKLFSGKYCMLASHDDLWFPKYISTLVKILEGDSDIVLAFSGVQRIDHLGDSFGRPLISKNNKLNETTIERVISVFKMRSNSKMYGLIRTDILSQTILFRSDLGVANDLCLITELSCHGKFYIDSEVLFKRRKHSGQTGKLKAKNEQIWEMNENTMNWIYGLPNIQDDLDKLIRTIKKEIKKHNSIGSIKWQIAKKIRLFKRHAPQRFRNLLNKTILNKALFIMFN